MACSCVVDVPRMIPLDTYKDWAARISLLCQRYGSMSKWIGMRGKPPGMQKAWRSLDGHNGFGCQLKCWIENPSLDDHRDCLGPLPNHVALIFYNQQQVTDEDFVRYWQERTRQLVGATSITVMEVEFGMLLEQFVKPLRALLREIQNTISQSRHNDPKGPLAKELVRLNRCLDQAEGTVWRL